LQNIGLRRPGLDSVVNTSKNQSGQVQSDGTRTVKIEGCKHQISSNPKPTLVEILSLFGKVISNNLEIMFSNGSIPDIAEDGRNLTKIYIVKVKLSRKIS
jgi:hypothetical protein